MTNQYKVQRRNIIKQWLRIRLGVLQMKYRPLLNILILPIIILIVVIWKQKDKVLLLIGIPDILYPIYEYFVNFMAVLLPILTLLLLLETIGNITAKKDETDLEEAFDAHDLRNGSPILMDKKRIKGRDVTKREFYTSISLKTWVEKQEDIADSMNVHFVEPLQYGGKSHGRRIVMYTTTGREMTMRGILYDDEL